jgi:hypothetical protein
MLSGPDFKNSLFVSYARDDNLPVPGGEKGWVGMLLGEVKTYLPTLRGAHRLGNYFLDVQGPKHIGPLSDLLKTELDQSRFLVVFLSEAYLRSRFCIQEFEYFFSVPARRNRILIVQLDDFLQDARRVSDIKKTTEANKQTVEALVTFAESQVRVECWVRDGGQARRFGHKWNLEDKAELSNKGREVAEFLANAAIEPLPVAPPMRPAPEPGRGNVLNFLRERPEAEGQLAGGLPAGAVTVFMALTPEELRPQRAGLESFIRKRPECVVVPSSQTEYWPRIRTQQQLAMELGPKLAALPRDRALFVQLIGSGPGQSGDLPEDFVTWQYESAAQAGLRRLIWRSQNYGLEDISAAERAIAEASEDVIAESIPAFRNLLGAQLDGIAKSLLGAQKKTDRATAAGQRIILLNAPPEDWPLIDQVKDTLKGFGSIAAFLPIRGNIAPEDADRDMAEHYEVADATVFVRDRGGAQWVRSQIRKFLRFPGGIKRPITVMQGDDVDLGVAIRDDLFMVQNVPVPPNPADIARRIVELVA